MFSSSPDRIPRQRDNAAPSALGTLPPSFGRRVAHTGSAFPCPILLALLLLSVLPSSVMASDSYTPPAAFDTWLANAFYVVALVTAVVILFQKLFPARKPTIDAEFVSKCDLDKWCAIRHSPIMEHLDRIEKQMSLYDSAREAADAIHEKRASKIHERVDRLTRVTYQIAGKLGIHESE